MGCHDADGLPPACVTYDGSVADAKLILLAEDDPDIQLVAKLALKRAGYRVTAVSNGRELLERVQVEKPDIVLLDWMMPEMDGAATCTSLHANPATADIPVVFMTARSQAAEIERGLALGAAGYIVKPFDALTLGDQLRRILADRSGDGSGGPL